MEINNFLINDSDNKQTFKVTLFVDNPASEDESVNEKLNVSIYIATIINKKVYVVFFNQDYLKTNNCPLDVKSSLNEKSS